MMTPWEFEKALHVVCKQIGLPNTLVADSHKAQKSKIKNFCDQVGTIMKYLDRKM